MKLPTENPYKGWALLPSPFFPKQDMNKLETYPGGNLLSYRVFILIKSNDQMYPTDQRLMVLTISFIFL